ncbi:alpha/beta fold hydrolase [Pseudoclavibacter endophyticus]|uniref:Alpha/beta fold hydrolase n=2 Tax=Pseudoclavibacter endophyticus TaxID=1778590 RepID=A0A6H9WQT4_9MICO|nr:alpha/beta fold hydrolase [Pseudoclavibacter endophyticus]
MSTNAALGADAVPASETGIVLLHGVGLDHTMWRAVQDLLPRASVAIDLPGHGAQPPLRTPQTLASLADDVLRRLPDGPVDLVGFSLGALIAQHLARFRPDRVRSLACVSSVCRRTEPERAAVEARLRTAHEAFVESAEASIERWYPAGTPVPAGDIEATRRTLLANDVESYLHAYAVFARGDAEIAGELSGITAPTLAVTGELDPGSTPDMSRRLADAIPGARAEIVPGARHMLPLEAPRALVAALITHLDHHYDTREGAFA